MNNTIIEVQNIFKSYENVNVLNGVSLTIQKGEVVSIVGASGAGKSTLLHIIGTLDKADKGEVFVNQTNINKLSEREMANFRNKNIGFIFQFHHLLPEFTALENICIPAYIAGKKPKEVEKKAKDLLSFLGLNGKFDNKPSELSGGEQQRTAVARALINDPAVILADEPSGNLDSNGADKLHQLFFDLRKEFNQTFVIVTHNNQLADISDKKFLMKDGLIC
jgi:lipoprotein-releasing system ATP-binding protein